MAEVAAVFFAVAAVTFVGFAAGRIFERTRFPDIPILLGIGILLGPLNRLAVERGWGIPALADVLDPDLLRDIGPYMSGVALVVILFDSGLKLDVQGFRGSLGFAFLHTMPIFLLTVAGIAIVARYVLGMEPLVAVVLGVAFSNVGQTVSAAIMRTMRVSDQTKSIGFVEMAIYDTISIPILVALFAFADGTGSAAWGDSLRNFAQLISISVSVAVAAGLLWILALRRLDAHPNSYMLTLAVLLTVYALNQVLGGSGAVSVLLFGLLMGNRALILRLFGRRANREPPSEKVQAFHDEITFLVRTVFFLYLGMGFRVGLKGQWPVETSIPFLDRFDHTATLFGIGIALIIVWFITARWAAISAFSARVRPETKALIPVFGHGLGTAVLATLPFVATQYQEGTPFHALFSRWEPVFLDAALLVTLLTVLLSSLLVWRQERALGARPPPGRGAAQSPGAPAPPSKPMSRPAPAPPSAGRAAGPGPSRAPPGAGPAPRTFTPAPAQPSGGAQARGSATPAAAEPAAGRHAPVARAGPPAVARPGAGGGTPPARGPATGAAKGVPPARGRHAPVPPGDAFDPEAVALPLPRAPPPPSKARDPLPGPARHPTPPGAKEPRDEGGEGRAAGKPAARDRKGKGPSKER